MKLEEKFNFLYPTPVEGATRSTLPYPGYVGYTLGPRVPLPGQGTTDSPWLKKL